MMIFSFIVSIIVAVVSGRHRYSLNESKRDVEKNISKLDVEFVIGMMVGFNMVMFAYSEYATKILHYYNVKFGMSIALIILFIVMMLNAGLLWLLLSFIIKLVSGLRRLELEEEVKKLRRA